jgi:hypothetical protein
MQELLQQWAQLKQESPKGPRSVREVEFRISQELAILQQLRDDGCLHIAGEPLEVPGLIRIHQQLLQELEPNRSPVPA